MTDYKWDRFFIRIARECAMMSKDPSSQIGAVIVDDHCRIIATGYNGFPPGIADDARLHDRDTKLKLTVHAETNALLQAGDRARGCTLYFFGFAGAPCAERCTPNLLAAGIARVVACGVPTPERWRASLDEAERLLHEAGVLFRVYDLGLLEGPEMTRQEMT